MDNVINKIIEIDNKAFAVTQSIQEMLKKNQRQLERDMARIETEALDEAGETARTGYQGLVKQGEIEEQRILREADHACEALEQLFGRIHEELEEDIFYRVFKK
jgi:IS5 family transposase